MQEEAPRVVAAGGNRLAKSKETEKSEEEAEAEPEADVLHQEA